MREIWTIPTFCKWDLQFMIESGTCVTYIPTKNLSLRHLVIALVLDLIWIWPKCSSSYIIYGQHVCPNALKRQSININDVYFDKVKYFWCLCKKRPLCSHHLFQFNNWTVFDFYRSLCIYVVRNMGQITYSKCKVARLLWFVRFGMSICGGVQLLSPSHLVDHRSIPLIF